MIYLSCLYLANSRVSVQWADNPYRIHQRLTMACERDPRLLFRLEDHAGTRRLIVQTLQPPNWPAAFDSFRVLAATPQTKALELTLQQGQCCRFLLRANPVVKRAGKRLGLLHEPEQRAWLERKLEQAGARPVSFMVAPLGFQRSHQSETQHQKHLAVNYEGILSVDNPDALIKAVEAGIGPAKGFGFGLLSLASAAHV